MLVINEADISLYDEFKAAADKYSSNNILGTREKLSCENEKQSDGKVLKKFLLAPNYEWMIFSDVLKTVNNLSNGFLKLGLKSNDNIVLFAETRPEWLISAFACFRIKVIFKILTYFINFSINYSIFFIFHMSGARSDTICYSRH